MNPVEFAERWRGWSADFALDLALLGGDDELLGWALLDREVVLDLHEQFEICPRCQARPIVPADSDTCHQCRELRNPEAPCT